MRGMALGRGQQGRSGRQQGRGRHTALLARHIDAADDRKLVETDLAGRQVHALARQRPAAHQDQPAFHQRRLRGFEYQQARQQHADGTQAEDQHAAASEMQGWNEAYQHAEYGKTQRERGQDA
ncbi:hypothetical protein D3C81_1868940 [compost metagenome]